MTSDEAELSAKPPEAIDSAARGGSDSTVAVAPPSTRTSGTTEPYARPLDDRIPAPLQPRDPTRYEILAEHGRGGLGRVYRARDRELGRTVALKELLAPTYRTELRFLREALITARLEHPGIVPIHEAGRWPSGTPFYSMKLVAGRSLTELLEEAKTIERRLALLPHLIAVADAIAYAHARKIIHRDLKPGNVIVGEFGETIVIDWGLAKDLTETTDDDSAGAPYRSTSVPGVTLAGSVLGTPAYMSPEQARGEPCDTRSDVYSLGAVLFQFCTGQAPPANASEADLRTALRPAPEDLATVALKSLSPVLDNRYADAADFGADLKAYDAGARIAARKYSLAAMLRLWIRHHKRLAISVALPTVVVAVLGGLALREIILRGDRATAARRQAEAARDELMLNNAELLLQSDPSAAAAVLDKYPGDAVARRDFLLSKAHGQGVARIVAQAHRDTVFFLKDIGDAILSVSADGRVARTARDGSHVLARDFSGVPAIAYVHESRTLIYAREPHGLAVLNVESGRSELRHADHAIAAVAVSPDGRQMAVFGQSGTFAVESLADPTASVQLRSLADAKRAAFAAANVVVVQAKDSIVSIDLSAPDERRTYPISANEVAAELAIRDGDLAIGSDEGTVHHIDLGTMTGTSLAQACEGPVNTVRFVPGRALVAFACHAGTAGIIDVESRSVIARFSTERPAYALATSPDGRLLLAGGQSRTVYVYDLETSFMTRYRGHPATISALLAPETDLFPLISGDVNGMIRVWETPHGGVRPLFSGTRSVFHAVFAPDGQYVVADGADGVVRMFDLVRNRLTELKGHTDVVQMVWVAPNSKEFASLSFDGSVRMWSRLDPGRSRVLSGHQGAVQDLCYLDATAVTSGTDGRLLAWSPDGASREMFRAPESFVSHECLASLDAVVAASTKGRLYVVSRDGNARILATEDAPITVLVASADGRILTGTSEGTVRMYREGADPRLLLQTGGSIAHLELSQPDDGGSRLLAVASEDARVYLRNLDGSVPPNWQDIGLPARSVRFSPDRELLAITCNDGAVLYYSLDRHSWTFTQPHQTDVFSGRFSPDGKRFVSSDGAGVVILHDLARIVAHDPMQKGASP